MATAVMAVAQLPINGGLPTVVIKHQRVRIAMCHLRHMDHPSKRGPEPMTAEEAGFVPDTPIKTPPAKRQRTSTEAQSATASAQ